MFKPSLNSNSQTIVMNKGKRGKVEEVLLKKGKEYKEKLNGSYPKEVISV